MGVESFVVLRLLKHRVRNRVQLWFCFLAMNIVAWTLAMASIYGFMNGTVVVLAEASILLVEVLGLRLLTQLGRFASEGADPLSFPRAFAISLIGNVVSFLIGISMAFGPIF